MDTLAWIASRHALRLKCRRLGLALFALMSMPVAVLAQSSQEQQWDFLRSTLDESAQHARYWQYGWSAFHAGSLGLSAYQASEADDPEDRYDARVTAVTSALGLLDLLWRPLPHPEVRERVEALYQQRDQNPEAYFLARESFERAARAETERRRWSSAIGATLVNLTAGLVIGIGDKRPEDGAITFASGMLVTGLKLWTLPSAAQEAWPRTTRVRLGEAAWKLDYAFHWGPQQVGLVVRF